MNIQASLHTTGSCAQIEWLTNTSKPFRNIQFPARFAHLTHPIYGEILIDTGYASHFLTETRRFPYNLYARLTPVCYREEYSAANQLRQKGIPPEAVRCILITHFHADHIAGLKDFPNAELFCSEKAYEAVRHTRGLRALKKGFIPSLLPNDFEQRVRYIEDCPIVEANREPVDLSGIQEKQYDLFGDQSVLAMDLSGHAAGQMGFYCTTKYSKLLFIADAAWDGAAVREYRLPSRVTALILADYKQFKVQLYRIHQFQKQYPDVRIIPFHCREAGEL